MLFGLKREAVAIVPDLSGKEEALTLLVRMTCNANSIDYFDEIHNSVLEREHALSTGIGLEIAVPHCRNGKLTGIINGALLVPTGIDYHAVDGGQVKLMLFIASPTSDIQGHLTCLSEISHTVADEEIRHRLIDSTTADELYERLKSLVTCQ